MDCNARSPSFNGGCEVAKTQAKIKQNPRTNQVSESEDYELDELIGVKKYKDLTARQIMKKMEDELGLKRLGNGAFGDVVESPDPNWVYKVLEKDPAYEEYIDFIAKNPNEHFPKIKRVKKMTSFFKRYQVQENKFLVVVIEKLEKIPQDRVQFAVDLVNDDVDSIPTHTPEGDKNYSKFTLEELMSHDWDGWTSEDMWSTYYAARTIHKSDLNRPHHSFMDLHRNNIMQRKDGTIVLIDPIASYEGLDYGSAISTARMAHDPMVKGPHYKPEPAQAGHGDDPYDTWDPHPPIDPGTTAWNNRTDATKPFPTRLPSDQLSPPWKGPEQQPALWSNDNGNTKKAFDEWKELFYKTARTPEEERRFDRLNAYLDQKKKMRQPVKTPNVDFGKTNTGQWSDRSKN